MKSIHNYIIEEATKWIGVTEIENNKKFTNPKFNKYLETNGWRSGEAYCMYLSSQIWRISYVNSGNSQIVKKLDKIFTPSAVTSFRNAITASMTSGTPQIGSIAIWQWYKNNEKTWMGHAGIVKNIDFVNNTFKTIEGNTGSKEREGDGVYEKNRILNYKAPKNGLRLLGFIIPIQVETIT